MSGWSCLPGVAGNILSVQTQRRCKKLQERGGAVFPSHSSKGGVVDYESQHNEGNYPEERERVGSFGEESPLQISRSLSVCDLRKR